MSPLRPIVRPALHAVLHVGFIPGATSFGEKGKRIALVPKPEQKESVMFFRTDHPDVTASLGLDNEKRCDGVILYLREDNAKPIARLIAVELKGKDHCHAVDQLAATLHALKTRLQPLLGDRLFSRENLRAVIVSPKGPEDQITRKFEQFKKQWNFLPRAIHANDESTLRRYIG